MGGPRAAITEALVAHQIDDVSLSGVVWCRCEQHFLAEQFFYNHQSEMVLRALDGPMKVERIRAQIDVLASVIAHYGPTSAGATTRSRNVYSGAQFAGWAREKCKALTHLMNAQ